MPNTLTLADVGEFMALNFGYENVEDEVRFIHSLEPADKLLCALLNVSQKITQLGSLMALLHQREQGNDISNGMLNGLLVLDGESIEALASQVSVIDLEDAPPGVDQSATLDRLPQDLAGLSSRAAGIIVDHKLEFWWQITHENLHPLRGCGAATIAELLAWKERHSG